ncbi:hypothetical protein [Sphingomonas sanxanigenens]|uniref:hypothetical protein n=1 Tax=Sphingomonas sanxanigenens TaxID=397260 RepID=UPI001B8094E7|nr:hypothetical protein [Sphingomonas sanxanigenens]
MNLKSLNTWIATVSMFALIAGCGGGGSGGGGVVVAPGNPTPSPSPTPTPTPTATRFSAVAVGPLLGYVQIDVSGNNQFFDEGDAYTYTSRSGSFGLDVVSGRPDQTRGRIPSAPIHSMLVGGLDETTGMTVSGLRAPKGATVISPLSTLIFVQGNGSTVLRALGLLTGSNALRSDTNVLTLNPGEGIKSPNAAVSEDAARIAVVNIQLLALSPLLKDTTGDTVDGLAPMDEAARYLTEVIDETGSVRLSEKATILKLLKKSRIGSTAPEREIDVVADLLSKYFSAMPERIADAAIARSWAYAFRFYVFPELRYVLSQTPSFQIERVSAITRDEIRSVAADFAKSEVPVMSELVAVPNYYELSYDSNPPYRRTLIGCSYHNDYDHPGCNDYTLFVGAEETGTVISVESQNANAISVRLESNGDVTISRVGNFTGLASFTYTTRSRSGATAKGTAFVRVWGL